MMQCADDDPFSFRAFSLDATVFEDNGTWYYIWAEKVGVGKQISNLYIAKMESATKLATVQVLLTTPDYDWERHGSTRAPASSAAATRSTSPSLRARRAFTTASAC